MQKLNARKGQVIPFVLVSETCEIDPQGLECTAQDRNLDFSPKMNDGKELLVIHLSELQAVESGIIAYRVFGTSILANVTVQRMALPRFCENESQCTPKVGG